MVAHMPVASGMRKSALSPTHLGACRKVPSLQKCWFHGCFLVECISARWVGAAFHGDIFTELTPAP